jgi:hypothetical protein
MNCRMESEKDRRGCLKINLLKSLLKMTNTTGEHDLENLNNKRKSM